MATDTEADPGSSIICPTCAERVSAEMTLWVLMGKWYCSEKCVRAALSK